VNVPDWFQPDQRILLAPRMVQSMEILQMDIMALQEHIDSELAQNPVLELRDASVQPAASDQELDEFAGGPVPEEQQGPTDPEPEFIIEGQGDDDADFDTLMAINEQWLAIPDLAIERTEKGAYAVRLLDEGAPPNLFIARCYIDLCRNSGGDPTAQEYLKKKIQEALWLIKALERRQSTLLKITRAIVAHQQVFLEKGPEYIEPLEMQQIADEVGAPLSTVRWAVANKRVQTPHGVLLLERFFRGGAQTVSGE
jgi:DNA-directed RNA polymerase specialized sigma54-like protein